MHQTKPPNQTQSAQSGTADAKPEKIKRGGARKVPPGMAVVKFLMPQAEFDHLTKMADDDDRKPEDLARVLARGAVKKDQQSKAGSAS